MKLPSSEPPAGFPNSALATAIPNQFFSRVLPQIEAPEELIVSLYFFFAQHLKHRSPRFLTKRELTADATLARSLSRLVARGPSPEQAVSALERGLDLSVWRGTLLRAKMRADGREEVYVVNTPANRKALEALADRDVHLDEPLPALENGGRSEIFSLYEQNIRPITPLIAEELAEAEKRYPAEWFHDAFREAVAMNKPSWRYVESILRRWETEGKQDEESGRDPQIEWLEQRYRQGKRRSTRAGDRDRTLT
jgi:DnaD/phage-associated family protein